jgi:selenocysteine lyase/cysteine desulfurase
VKEIVRLAHAAGAPAYIDAVHYAPHGLIDVADLDCDFLVCSTYKFFGPHMGVLFGKREHLQRLRPYKVRPNTNAIPNCWEWGTLNHECIAGIAACVEYLAEVGRQTQGRASLEGPFDSAQGRPFDSAQGGQPRRLSPHVPGATERRAAIESAYKVIQEHERSLTARLISGLSKISALRIYGITDPARFGQRCGTLAVRAVNQTPANTPLAMATKLGDRGIFTWDGNYYALNLTEKLGVEKSGGFLRIGLVHYNTAEEIDCVLAALGQIAES